MYSKERPVDPPTMSDGEYVERLEADVEQLREALPDPVLLRMLADWFDAAQDAGQWGEDRVQKELRRLAESAEQLGIAGGPI